MKKYFIFLLLFFLVSFSFAGTISIDKSYYTTSKVPGFILGPSSFNISDGNIYVCNPLDNNILVKSQSKTVLLSNQGKVKDIEFINGKMLKLYDDHINYDNNTIPLHQINGSIKFISVENNKIYLAMGREITYIIDMNGKITDKKEGLYFNGKYYKSSLFNSGFKLRIGDKLINVQTPFEPASASIEAISNHTIALIVEKLISVNPIKAEQYVYVLNDNGIIKYNNVMPNIHYFYFPHPLRIYNDTLYYAIANRSSLDIVKLYPSPESLPTKYFNENYNYNSSIPAEPQINVPVQRADTSITRTEVINVADSYVNHTFYASSANITNGIIVDPNGDTVRTPSWVTVGNHSSVPYKWGGFSSLSQFDNGLSSNLYAGDNYTGNNVSSYAVGVDCSGFVSRCWGTSSKYGTSTIPNISTALSSLNDLRRGDCLNYAGHHVRLAAEDNPDGTVYICEASGVDWKVAYRTYNFTDLTNYQPRRYDNIVDDTVYQNDFVVRVTNCSNLNLREGPGTSYNVISTVPAGNSYVVTDYNSSGWYKIVIPSGIGYTYGWSYGGTDLSGYLTGNARNPVFKVKSFKSTLNVRSGPTTDSSIITTITSGQEFAVLDSSGHWYKISIPAINGYTYGWCSAGASGTYGEIVTLAPTSPYGAEISNPIYNDSLSGGSSETVTLTIKNTGTIPFDDLTYLAVTNPRYHNSLLRATSWIDSTNIGALPSLLPGQTDTVSFTITNNSPVDTTLIEYITLKEAGFRWFSDTTELGPTDTDFYLTLNLVGTSGIKDSYRNVKNNLKINGINRVYLLVNYMPNSNEKLNYTVYSLSGRKLKEGQLKRGENKISLMNLPVGTYLFKAGNRSSRKFILLK